MLNEECIRIILKCVDRYRLDINELTGNTERSGEVFVNACRWVDFYGPSWVKNDDESDRSKRRYRSSYRTALVLRRLIRRKGFLVNLHHPRQPFFTIDLTQELHPDFHNFKIKGEANFEKNLQQLRDGVSFGELSNSYVPRTLDDEERVKARMELTKEQLFKKVQNQVTEALKMFPGDDYLKDCDSKLVKTSKVFKTKGHLVEFSTSLDTHVENLDYVSYIPCDDD